MAHVSGRRSPVPSGAGRDRKTGGPKVVQTEPIPDRPSIPDELSWRDGSFVPLQPFELVLPPPCRVLGSIAPTADGRLPHSLLDLVHEIAPVGEAVGVAPQPDPSALLFGWRSIPPEVQPQEHAIRDVADARTGTRHVEVEESRRPPVDENGVHRGDVVVADDLFDAGQRGAGGRIVVSAEQTSCVGQLLVGQSGVEVVRDEALDVGKALSPLVVDPEEARRVGEADLLQVAEDAVYEGRVRTDRPPNRVTDSDDALRDAASQQRDFSRLSGMRAVCRVEGRHVIQGTQARFRPVVLEGTGASTGRACFRGGR